MDAQGNSQAQSGYGTGFFLKVANKWLEVDEVTQVPMAEQSADEYEVTHFKSPKKKKEWRTGLTDDGEGTLEINYIPGSPTDVALRAARASGEVCEYETFLPAPNGKWLKISGFLIVKSRGRAVPINDRMTQTVTVRFTGDDAEAEAANQRVIAAAA
ncbi:phage tail tube protein [uncultured Sphingomonas sp.]|uniref:phage tail tube protein n=1 Tax=uncultured Sphingomonas sp. TaxID=158754 RepID=UPI0025CE454B|nr:phage tail tube protein [uncultured Sphingomonas sp.]